MNPNLVLVAIVSAFLSLSSCVYYEPVPQPTLQQRFDRSWAAAAGAMSDQGVTTAVQDRGAGVIRGERAGVSMTATVETLADGRIQVAFSSPGSTSTDPGLVQRVHESYERRMGR